MARPPWLKDKQTKKRWEYTPTPGGPAFVLLVSMLKAMELDRIQNMTRDQVMDNCTRFHQSAMREPSRVWAGIKSLIDKGFIHRQISRDPIYSLTDDGIELAKRSIASAEAMSTGIMTEESSSSTQVMTQDDGSGNFELEPGSFDVILVIDQREKIDTTRIDASTKHELRTLACGDFIWLARPKGMSPADRTRDLVLDYVVERKRLDDLAASIMDGRFDQQKQRLKNSGIRRPLYLIEDCGLSKNSNMSSSSLMQSAVNILIQDGIAIERSKNNSHSIDYLVTMTRCLNDFYSKMALKSCDQERLRSGEASKNEMMTFTEFQTKSAKIKNWTVREMFAKHLIQIAGMSEPRVAVIINKYPTLSHLLEAYDGCETEKDKENLLSKMAIPDSNRTIGPALSKRVYCCYKKL